jgi:hypothetical protein
MRFASLSSSYELECGRSPREWNTGARSLLSLPLCLCALGKLRSRSALPLACCAMLLLLLVLEEPLDLSELGDLLVEAEV